jgi:hypothetical protein
MKRAWPLLLALLGRPAFAADQTLQITTDANDGCESGLGWVNNADGYVEFGGGGGECGFSFLLTTEIPSGATIDAAYLGLTNTGDNNGAHTIAIHLEDADPASVANFDNSTEKPSDKSWLAGVSTGSRTYSSGSYFGDGETGATDIASLIQSVVTSYGTLAIGERLNFMIDATAGDMGAYSQWEDFSNAGTGHATLYIEWTAAGGGGSAVPVILQQMGSVEPANDDEYERPLVANAR